MANFAVVSGNVITNIIVAETLEDARTNVPAALHVEISDEPGSPGIGWVYDESTESFTKPEVAS